MFDPLSDHPAVPQKEAIRGFQGDYRWLSNFWRCDVTHDGITYSSVEHAYQAAKTLDFQDRWDLSQLPTPGLAKKAGRDLVLRLDWMQVRERVMSELLVQKFLVHTDLKKKLLDTGDAPLVEENTWGDTFWGVCKGQGENHLGILLMGVRARLRA